VEDLIIKTRRVIMFNSARRAIFISLILLALYAFLAGPLLLPANAGFNSAPLAPGHDVDFMAAGLPDGVLFTITGTRVNNGGHPTDYTVDFTTPDTSASLSADAESALCYGFLTYRSWRHRLNFERRAGKPIDVGNPGSNDIVATYQVFCAAEIRMKWRSRQVENGYLYRDERSLLLYQWIKTTHRLTEQIKARTHPLPRWTMKELPCRRN
jgi:hypothetical protein